MVSGKKKVSLQILNTYLGTINNQGTENIEVEYFIEKRKKQEHFFLFILQHEN